MKDLLFLQQRADANTEKCEYCGQEIGSTCVNPKTGRELEHQAAHHVRLVAAGVAQPAAGGSNAR